MIDLHNLDAKMAYKLLSVDNCQVFNNDPSTLLMSQTLEIFLLWWFSCGAPLMDMNGVLRVSISMCLDVK